MLKLKSIFNFFSVSILIISILVCYIFFDYSAFIWFRLINGTEVIYKNNNYTLSEHGFKLDKEVMWDENNFLIGIQITQKILVSVKKTDFNELNAIVDYVLNEEQKIHSMIVGDCHFYFNSDVTDMLPEFFWYNHKLNFYYYLDSTNFLEQDKEKQLDYNRLDYIKLCNVLSKKD